MRKRNSRSPVSGAETAESGPQDHGPTPCIRDDCHRIRFDYMPTENGKVTYCNSRKKGRGDDLPKRDPGPEHVGDGYCSQTTEGGRCYMHGRDSTQPTKHGLYSFKREQLEERFREAYSGQDWADLRAEIAAVRALLSDYFEGLEEVDSDSIGDVAKLVSELRRLTSDLQEMLHRERLTRDEEQKLFDTLAEIIRDHVPESERGDAQAKLQQAATASGGGRPLPNGR
jgi:hypothetical protein